MAILLTEGAWGMRLRVNCSLEKKHYYGSVSCLQRVGHETESCSLGKKTHGYLAYRWGHETECCSLGKNSLLWLSCLQRVAHETECCSLGKKNSLLWLSCLYRGWGMGLSVVL